MGCSKMKTQELLAGTRAAWLVHTPAQWLREWALVLSALCLYQPRIFGQVTSLLCASVSLSVKGTE